MGRTPNIKFNAEAFEEALKKYEGANYKQSRISEFIMGKNPTYLCECLKKKLINPDVLKKVCKYYDLTPEDYIITEEVEKKQIQQKADTMNYDNVILLLTDISKTLKELLAAEKSTQFMLGELKNSLLKSNAHEKQIIEKMEAAEKQKQAHRNTVSKIYG